MVREIQRWAILRAPVTGESRTAESPTVILTAAVPTGRNYPSVAEVIVVVDCGRSRSQSVRRARQAVPSTATTPRSSASRLGRSGPATAMARVALLLGLPDLSSTSCTRIPVGHLAAG